MNRNTLVFPAGMTRSLEYLESSHKRKKIIGASSIVNDSFKSLYNKWINLPFVTDDNFKSSLIEAIKQYNIGEIFTPNPVIWECINGIIKDYSLDIEINKSPILTEIAPYQASILFAENLIKQPLRISTSGKIKKNADLNKIASVFRHGESIPGMCDRNKLSALCEIARCTPEGDIVEIGSWWGKSAFILTALSDIYKIGKVLCIDPWTNLDLLQNDKKNLVDKIEVDANFAFEIFNINLLLYAGKLINYIRKPSNLALQVYTNKKEISTPEFGSTKYKGTISILHIDGNHSYDNAIQDIRNWCPLVSPGGWIIIDDYTWPYGDGPKKAADEYFNNSEMISTGFVMGGALFIKTNE